MTAPTSPKPHTPANPNDLRTALTQLAEGWDSCSYVTSPGEAIRALLAAHPAEVVSDTRREDVAVGDPRWGDVQRYDIRHAYASAGPGDYVQRAAHFDAVMDQPALPDVKVMSPDVVVGVGTRAALDSLPFDNPTITYRERELIRAAVLAVLPAPPVVADIMRDINDRVGRATFEGGDCPVYAVPLYVVEDALDARLRGATRD